VDENKEEYHNIPSHKRDSPLNLNYLSSICEKKLTRNTENSIKSLNEGTGLNCVQYEISLFP